ncbi:hypothetical protein PM082_022343 [Marasmius tenuissimus]|nr:hypothetical protein PM082_022343 [Marasmius tenuissimus]
MLQKSPVSKVFNTNYTPSDAERHQINAILVDPFARLRVIEEEMSKLSVEREQIRSYIHDHTALLSPFRRVPEDIYREIFMHCLPRADFISPSTGHAPLLLTAVCRQWRAIAVSMPKLWSSIRVAGVPTGYDWDPVAYKKLIRGIDEGVKLWLTRAGSSPLRLSLRDLRGGDLSARFERTILQSAPRWNILELRSVSEETFETLVAVDAPSLKKLYLSRSPQPRQFGWLSRSYASPTISQLHRFLENSLVHDLRTDEYWGDCVDLFGEPTAHWSRLTIVHMAFNSDCSPPHEIIEDVARLCPALSVFVVKFPWTGAEVSYDAPQSRVPFSHLRKFHLSFSVVDEWQFLPIVMENIDRVFVAIEAPALTDLQLKVEGISSLGNYKEYGYNTPLDFDMTLLHDFLTSSGCHRSLERLTISYLWHVDSLMDFLSILPRLTSLTIIRRNDPHLDKAFRPGRLLSLFADVTVCPALENLELVDFSREHAERILKIADARVSAHGSGTRLKTLKVSFFRKHMTKLRWTEAKDIQSALASLQGRGLKVEWEVRV